MIRYLFSSIIFVIIGFSRAQVSTVDEQSSLFNQIIWPVLLGPDQPQQLQQQFRINTILQFDGFVLRGELPEELGQLLLVEEVWLSGHQLTGEIPASLALLPSLRVLYLDGNSLTGEMPPALANHPTLEVLWLSRNRLSGTLPPFVSSALRELVLFGNSFSGPAPPIISSVQRCQMHRNSAPGNCFDCPLSSAIPVSCFTIAGYAYTCSDSCNAGQQPVPAPPPPFPQQGAPPPPPILTAAPPPPLPPSSISTAAPSPSIIIVTAPPTPSPSATTTSIAEGGSGLDGTTIGLLAAGGAIFLLICWFFFALFLIRMIKSRRRHGSRSTDTGSVRMSASSRDATSGRARHSRRRGSSVRRHGGAVGGASGTSFREHLPAMGIQHRSRSTSGTGIHLPPTEASTPAAKDAAADSRPIPSDYDVGGMLAAMKRGTPNYESVAPLNSSLPDYDNVAPLGNVIYSQLGPAPRKDRFSDYQHVPSDVQFN